MKKTLSFVIFLLGLVAILGIIVTFTASATVSRDDESKSITITEGDYTVDKLWDESTVDDDVLINESCGVYLANYTIVVSAGSLEVAEQNCTWLKLNCTNATGKNNSGIQVYGTGRLYVNDSMITGWNYTRDDNETWTLGTKFRPWIYIISTGDSTQPHAQFLNSTIGYLGFDMDNKYGIVFEDFDTGGTRYQPTGWMHNCTVIQNFIGIDFQGCENMNVTNTWMNETHEVGIVYTVGGSTSHGANNGYIGDHPTWTHRDRYEQVAVDDCHGDPTAMAIRLCNSDNITLEYVAAFNATTHGIYIEVCDNITANNTGSYANTNAADEFNWYLYNMTNSTITNCSGFAPSGAVNGGNWFLTGCIDNYFNTLSAYESDYHEDYYLDNDTHDNQFISCTSNNSNIGYYIQGYYNNLTSCTTTVANGEGFYLLDNARHNNFSLCQGTSSNIGLKIVGNVNNNSFTSCSFVQNAWGLHMWPNAGSDVQDNSFTSCFFNQNTQTGIDIGRTPMNYFYDCNATTNVVSGIELRNWANTTFSNCVSYQPSASSYDWIIENTANTTITGNWILGYNATINEQTINVDAPYGSITHDHEAGALNLYTLPAQIYTNDAHNCTVNFTHWTNTGYRKWYVTGTSGTYLYQKIGGLDSTLLYDLKVNGDRQGTYTPYADTLLGVSSDVAWFNYTGGWSTHYFEITPHTSDDDSNGGGGGGGGDSGSDTDDTTTPSQPSQDNMIFYIIIAVIIIVLIIGTLFYYKK